MTLELQSAQDMLTEALVQRLARILNLSVNRHKLFI
jgi:hypothetical protein